MASYEKLRAEFERLEKIAELTDQVELDAEREWLMQNPNKASAARLYEMAIDAWHKEHGDEECPKQVKVQKQ